MNTITIELCAEDRARLDAILEALKNVKAPNCESCVQSMINWSEKVQRGAQASQDASKDAGGNNSKPERSPAPDEALKAEAAPWEAPAEPNPFPEQAKAEPAPDVNLSDLQSLVVRLATTGKKAEARDIVKAYAERVTAIPPEKFGEVFTKLKALEG